MSKNQKTYVLLAMVLTIWGILGFKVVKGLGSNEPIPERDPIAQPYVAKTTGKRDSIFISANYRDPFLGTPVKTKPPTKLSKKKKKIQKLPKKNIVFSGSVAGNESNTRMFFVTIEGEQHIMEKNQKINGVVLVWGTLDEIRVSYPGHSETIKLAQ